MWVCNICAASYERKGAASRHINMLHITSQGAQVVFNPHGEIAPMETPNSAVETDTSEEEDLGDNSVN